MGCSSSKAAAKVAAEPTPVSKEAATAAGTSPNTLQASADRNGKQVENENRSQETGEPVQLRDKPKEPSGESLNRKPIPAIPKPVAKPVAFEINLEDESNQTHEIVLKKPELPSKLLDKIEKSEVLTPQVLKSKQEAAEKRRQEREREQQEKLKDRGQKISKAAHAAKKNPQKTDTARLNEGRPATMEEELALAAAVQRLERVHAGDERTLYGHAASEVEA